MADIRFTAKSYIDAGWSIVPVLKGKKAAASDWSKKIYSTGDFGADDNIAGKCGEPSGWRIDVDCDSPEALIAVKTLLPQTGLIHGRPGNPDSHHWFICDGIKTKAFTDIKNQKGDSETLIEIRSTGGYTVLPPSIWTDKNNPSHTEEIAWTIERSPLVLTPEELYNAVRSCGLAALLGRHWPGSGARHHMVGHLAGFLAHAKLSEFIILEIIKTAATIAGDSDIHDRVVFAKGTLDKFAAGANVSGGPKLSESLGEDVVNKMRGWLKMADTDAIEEMNAKHFVVRLGSKEAIGLEEGDNVIFQTRESLNIRYCNRKVPVDVTKKGEPILKTLDIAWLESKARREFRNVVFSPPPRHCEPLDYNLWKGFAVAPSDAPCDLYLNHLHEVICSDNTEHFDFLMNVLAQTIQEPGTPSGIATVLRGQQGTGKGAFVRGLELIFGRRHFTQLDKVEQLTGKFNASLSGKVIVFADEAFWGGDKRDVGALKRLITEPTLRIERKNFDGVDEDNHVHLFMATNEEWSWPAAMDDRRGFLLEVSSKYRRNAEYFEALFTELKNGGAGGLLKYLLEWPIDHRRLKHVPRTKELRQQQTLTLPPEMAWWHECLYDTKIGNLGWPGGQWIPVNGLFAAYEIWLNNRRGRILSKIEFSRRMGEFFSGDPIVNRRISGEQARCAKLFSISQARDYFDARLDSKDEWPSEMGNSATF